jgi:predicted TIM-barrel fold metal-dependent hydrolase
MDLMDRHEIDASILSISESGVFFGDMARTKELSRACNDYAANLVARTPSRLGAFGVLPLPDTEAALAEIGHCSDVLKMDGFILHSNIDGKYLGDPEFDPVFRELNQRRSIVYIHPISPPWANSAKTSLPTYLCDTVGDTTRTLTTLLFYGTLHRYPDIRWIVAHGGGTIPFIVRRLSMMSYNEKTKAQIPYGVEHYIGRMHFDTGLMGSGALSFLRSSVSDSKILFGSDYPFAPEGLIQGLCEEVIGEAKSRGCDKVIEYENAIQLFPRFSANVDSFQKSS